MKIIIKLSKRVKKIKTQLNKSEEVILVIVIYVV